MKRKIFLALFSILALLLPLNLRGEVVDRIVALVNGEIITLSELEQMGKPFYDQVRQTSTAGEREEKMKKARIEVLDRLIDSRLLEEEMKKRKIEVPERDVDAAIQDVLKSSNLTENDMKKALAREGMTYSTYRQRVRDELGKMRLVSREIKSKIVIEDVVLRDYYQKNLEKFTDPLEVKIQQIFFPVPEHASQEETAAVEREARPILERARKGEDFAELARKFSKGPEAGEGGLLGYFKHRELMPELEEAGFKLRPGEISDLVRSPAGFHILRVLERKGGEPRPFAEVQFKIREELSEAEAQKKFEQWMKELKSKAYIEIRL
ncbi:MAG: peptidylprolyl isomerase [Deltaproteobacteria bacterium]|nr:peptidylprolyl isomerase [Deltaproteobacteria bacterium]